MQRLIEGIHSFQRSYFSKRRTLFEKLSHGQQPLALFITCSDSRIDPGLLTQTEPGELFILRNAGNIVPSFGAVEGGEAATIEYAVSVLKVRDIVVCGHSLCGAMTGLIQSNAAQNGGTRLESVESWLKHAASTRRIIEENYAHITDPQHRLMAAVQENVLVQLENIRTHPCVAAALGRHDLNLHGWVYKIETGQVFAYEPEHGQFSSLSEPGAARALADSQVRECRHATVPMI